MNDAPESQDPSDDQRERRYDVRVRRGSGQTPGNGQGRPQNWALRYEYEGEELTNGLRIRGKDWVSFHLPKNLAGSEQRGWLTFIRAEKRRVDAGEPWTEFEPGASFEGDWPFGNQLVRITGPDPIQCVLPRVTGIELRYRYTFYLEGPLDDLVDENSPPAIIVREF